jgi:hypothetical protein
VSPPAATSPAPPRQSGPTPSGRGVPADRSEAGATQNRARGQTISGNTHRPPAPPTTDTTVAPVTAPPLDQAAIDAAAAAAAAATAPAAPAPVAPTEPPPVEPIDPAILDTLAAARGDKPPDDGSGLLVGAGLALGLFLLAVAARAFYHRSSRYMPA